MNMIKGIDINNLNINNYTNNQLLKFYNIHNENYTKKDLLSGYNNKINKINNLNENQKKNLLLKFNKEIYDKLFTNLKNNDIIIKDSFIIKDKCDVNEVNSI